MSKEKEGFSFIGGADGPTSVFLAGQQKEKNLSMRIRYKMKCLIRRYKRIKAKRQIKPKTHTMEETIRYMKKRYSMVEADSNNFTYLDNKRSMLFSLIQRERTELLPKQPLLVDREDTDAIKQWHQEMTDWMKKSEEAVKELPSDTINMDYHMFILDRGQDGSMQVEVEINRGLMEVQYSGKGFAPILRDIYLFYGVSWEDIENKTDRYKHLLSVLAH